MGRAAATDRLPPDVRAWLEHELRNSNFTGYEALAEKLKDKGYPIGATSLWRYGKRMKQLRAKSQIYVEMAKFLPQDDEDALSGAVLSMIQSNFFDIMMAMDSDEEEDNEKRLKMLSDAAHAMANLSRASVNQKKWSRNVREEDARKLAALEKEAKTGKSGLDMETLKRVREEIYGLA